MSDESSFAALHEFIYAADGYLSETVSKKFAIDGSAPNGSMYLKQIKVTF